MALHRNFAFLLLGSVLECACSTGGASPIQSTSRDAGGDAASRVRCPTDSGIVSEPPSGACEGSGSCALEVDAKCGPGVRAVPGSPTVYICECASGTWSCKIVGGSFNIVTCGDSGVDNGASDADVGVNS